MRRGEILHLTWSQVDLQKRLIRIQETKSRKDRFIPINDDLHCELSRLKALDGNSALIFMNSKTGKPYAEVNKSFKSARRRAGIKDLRFHDLRHTFAIRLIERGADIITVKELLGHHSVRITQRYTHSNQLQKKWAVGLLAQRSAKSGEKAGNLLRICDTERPEVFDGPVNRSESIN